MAEIKELHQIPSLPGIRRDGTMLDGDFFTDGQWVRFQRGRPKKMGGYKRITDAFTGPIRSTLVWSRGLLNAVYSFSSSRIEMMLVDGFGTGGSLYNRTPVGFVDNPDHIWSVDTMYDDAVGSQGTIVVAVATNALTNIDDSTAKQVYFGLADDTVAFQAISGLTVSGGVLCISPYLVYFGSDGLVGWTDANQPRVLTGGDAGSDRVTGTKIVKGLPVRGGNGPSALLWSLDSVISMQWVGGSSIFRFTTLSAQSSILSQNGVIEYDGEFFWPGVDRFLTFSGGRVQELPNDNNLNWFFDNLNFEYRQKVWAMKVPRYGEIWWFFPFGEATECTHAVIYNVREKTWYDTACARSSGFYSQVFRYPVMSNAVAEPAFRRITITSVSGSFLVGDTVVATTSNVVFVIVQDEGSNTYKIRITGAVSDFVALEGLNNLSRVGTATLASNQMLYSSYVHEFGRNAIEGEVELAIESHFTTSDFGYPTGGPQTNQLRGVNRWTRIVRVEPDFILSGDLEMEVIGREFAQAAEETSETHTIMQDTDYVDLREQYRQIRLKFTSNDINGHYEMGRTLLHTEPGDVRS